MKHLLENGLLFYSLPLARTPSTSPVGLLPFVEGAGREAGKQCLVFSQGLGLPTAVVVLDSNPPRLPGMLFEA